MKSYNVKLEANVTLIAENEEAAVRDAKWIVLKAPTDLLLIPTYVGTGYPSAWHSDLIKLKVPEPGDEVEAEMPRVEEEEEVPF